MVPDVSGIDKTFDYLVPESIAVAVSVGNRVRVDLHGRRVGGWIVALGQHGDDGFTDVPIEKLIPIAKHSGSGVVPHLVPVALGVARKFFGPTRAVFQSASSPRVTRSIGRAVHGAIVPSDDAVASCVTEVATAASGNGHSVHVVTIPPLESVLSLIAVLAQQGPVLVVCPTVRMAVLGAASLRRRGCSVALMPDDWDKGFDSVDVAIGARSSVWAPLVGIASVVVVDEHDDSLKEERVPTWHAREVAIQRAQHEDIPCYLCSPVSSVESLALVSGGDAVQTTVISDDGWPRVQIADLNTIPIVGSLASSEMIQLVRRQSESVLCILNTKGKARLLACAQCRTIARCEQCQSAMSSDDPGILHCVVCDLSIDAICRQCGRTSFKVLRSGIGRLREEIEKASGRNVLEVDASTEMLDMSHNVGVYVGTEALLHRVTGANHVVFLDFDAEVLAPRATATRDALSLVIRAARVVGKDGSIVLQTRNSDHDLLQTLAVLSDTPSVLRNWQSKDLQLRQLLQLPPHASLARVRLDAGLNANDVFMEANTFGERNAFAESALSWAHEKDNTFLVRCADESVLRSMLQKLREQHGQKVRIDFAPVRY